MIPGTDGQAGSTIGPDGAISQTTRDKLGQALRAVEALGTDAERVTSFRWHASGQMPHLILENPATGEQVTEWLFGTTLATSGIARNDLVSGKIWPTGESESLTYNRQGDVTQRTDPNGSVRAFTYDQLGKPLDDSATTVASGVDGTLRRVSTVYNDRGLRDTITTYSDPDGGAGNVINQVKLDYDAFNQLITDRQEHDGEVDGATPEVGYGYTNGSGNVLRRTSVTAPGGARVDFAYGTASSLDDVFNRVASLRVNGETDNLVDYDWCGLGRIATLAYPTPDAELSYLKPSGATGAGDAGDDLTGYDRFDRTIRMPWKNGTSGTVLADIAYGYDAASRRQWRQDLTPAAENAFDQFYRYDTLGQVKTADRGTLNENRTAIGGIPGQAEAWRYDEQGNWLDYDKAEDGASVIEQTRRSNQSNQLVSIDGSSAGVAYDKNGNMTRIPTGDALTGAPRKLVWNVWDQLVEVRVESTNALIQRNAYDGLFRRTTRELADGTVIHQYHNDQWKPIEERKDASTDPLNLYFWGARTGHRDDLIRRDRDTDGNGALDETLWCLMDYFDPIAILNSAGAVQERYIYSAFGVPLILAPDYAARTSSGFDWGFLFHGQFTDEETGYQNFGFRFYVPELGRWISRDSIGEEGGFNLYSVIENDNVNDIDFIGRQRSRGRQNSNQNENGTSVEPRGISFVFGQSLTVTGCFPTATPGVVACASGGWEVTGGRCADRETGESKTYFIIEGSVKFFARFGGRPGGSWTYRKPIVQDEDCCPDEDGLDFGGGLFIRAELGPLSAGCSLTVSIKSPEPDIDCYGGLRAGFALSLQVDVGGEIGGKYVIVR